MIMICLIILVIVLCGTLGGMFAWSDHLER